MSNSDWDNLEVVTAKEAADKDEEDKMLNLKQVNEEKMRKKELGYLEDEYDRTKPTNSFKPHPSPGTITPRRGNLKGTLRKILEYKGNHINAVTDEMEYLTTGEALMFKLIKRGLDGNLKAIELILDRLEGKAKSSVEVSADIKLEENSTTTVNHDFSSLSIDELLFVQKIMQKTKATEIAPEAVDEDNPDQDKV